MRVLPSLLALLAFASPALADLPSPRFDRLTPLGAAAGSEVEVEVGGGDIEGATRLVFDHPGITATHVKDRKFKVTVAADVPPGTYDARVVGKYGVTNPRLFAVSKGLTEVADALPKDPSAAQLVPVNCVVNGSSKQGREDVFRFVAKKGQRVVVECFAQRLDSQLDANLTLTDAEGRQLASSGDYAGKDPLVEFVAPKDGDYLVQLNDLSFRGGHPYRLVITDQPQVENVLPRAVQAGKKADLTVFGRNLGSGAKPSQWVVTDVPLDALTESVSVPDDVLKRGGYRFTDHPTGHSVLPTAATATLTGFQHRGVPLLVTDTAVSLEQEPNDDPLKPQKIELPAVVSGRFDKERDADWYEFEVPENGAYSFDVYCERIAGRADPYLVVLDEKDARVGELDDSGIRSNAFDALIRDASGSINLNAKKKYRVLVQDRYRRGGARYQYVLSIRKPVPDVFPAVIHHQTPGPGGTTVRRGGSVPLDVYVHNTGGFNGPVTITAEGLPKGLRVAPAVINNDTKGVVVLTADKDAPEYVGPIKLVATAKRGDETVVREVRSYTRVWNSTDLNSSRPTRELVVAIADELAPFALTPAVEKIEIEAGKKGEVVVKCERLWPEFKGAVTLIPLSFPNPIKMGTANVAEGKTEATVTLDVQANARPGEYSVVIEGQGQVPVAKDGKDGKAGAKANTLVPLPARPVTVVVLPAPKK
ncbi:PPC domain-containing protein [Gemmata sp.]|uniref:PPC domain-containing protein n=1 Tax=Gemmata sp. TaxID=1914242 RepID=UPI003F72814F